MQALAAAFATGTRQPSSRVGQRMFKVRGNERRMDV